MNNIWIYSKNEFLRRYYIDLKTFLIYLQYISDNLQDYESFVVLEHTTIVVLVYRSEHIKHPMVSDKLG